MTNSKWYAFKMWLSDWVARHLPETIKRHVLYILADRVTEKLPDHEHSDLWGINFEQLYKTLGD
jgi:hypothetical protein